MHTTFLLVTALLFIIYFTIMFLIVHVKKDISIGNFSWGGGVMLFTICSFFMHPITSRHILITFLILLWGLRLTLYVYLRYKKGADPRYVTWQDRQGRWYLLFAVTWIYICNGGFSIIMSLPSIVVNSSQSSCLSLLDILGTLLWMSGFLFENLADYQLSNFIKNAENKGKVMQEGLWHYSRHPNYFGEILMWLGIYFIALSAPYGWLTIITPLAITTTLVFITGIPMNEKTMANSPEYQEYKKKTSMLIPWKFK